MGVLLISLFFVVCFTVCEGKAMYCFNIHSSFNPLQASITQIEKGKSGACV